MSRSSLLARALRTRNAASWLDNLVPLLSLVLTVVISLGTILAFLLDDSEDGIDLPGGDFEIEQMRTDLLTAINHERTQAAEPIAILDYGRHNKAQSKAKLNAETGEERPTDENVAMVQANLPTADATADAFLGLWMGSEPHRDAILDSAHTEIGIGIATSEDRVWAVVQFTND